MTRDDTLPASQRLLRVWGYFSDRPGLWVQAVIATIVVSATEPLIPDLLQKLLDQGFGNPDFPLWFIPLALISVFGVRGISSFAAQLALAKIAHGSLVRLRQLIFGKLLDARLDLYAQNNASGLANIAVYDIQSGATLLVNAVMTLARDSLTLVALVVYLLYLNWKLTLIVAALFPAIAWVMKTLTRRLQLLTHDSLTATDDLAYVVEENVLAHRDIRLHGAQAAQSERFGALGGSLYRLAVKSTIASSLMTPITQVLAAVALSAVISVAVVQSGSDGTTRGAFVAFVTAMLMLVAPIKHLSEIAGPITRGLAAIERGLDLIEHTPSETEGSHTQARASGHLHFQHLGLNYPGAARPALDDIELEVQPGERLALVGTSGAGKTSLINLLPRYLEPTSGQVLLDGVALSDWSLPSLRQQFAIVSQHVVMLNDSVAVNVALGQPIDLDRVRHCLRAANLDPEAITPELVVGHNATQLSGGQRQRLAIARALYKDAPILILDEATSALDTESERAVQEALTRLMEGRTSLVIAHRLSTIQHADRIVVLDAGRIVEMGTHADLLARDGMYARLYRLGFQDA